MAVFRRKKFHVEHSNDSVDDSIAAVSTAPSSDPVTQTSASAADRNSGPMTSDARDADPYTLVEPVEGEESPSGDKSGSAVPSKPGASASTDAPLAQEIADLTRRRRMLAADDLPRPETTRVITVANQKGGVGKTTSTVNLAAALARTGARVIVIDLDPQGNASTALGVEHRSETASVYDVIINDVPIEEVIQKSPEFPALYCIPATIHLAGAEIELVSLVAREQRLRRALDLFLDAAEPRFDYVFIDCPPSLGLLTINAFVAAREVLIPIQCEYYALEGLSQLLKNIELIEKHLNPALAVSTILLTMYDIRTNLANQVVQDVREHFPKEVLQTLIPRSVRISEAPSYGQTVVSYDPNSPGSLSYREAAAEIARRGAPV
jgi:chromosome partitioning protein